MRRASLAALLLAVPLLAAATRVTGQPTAGFHGRGPGGFGMGFGFASEQQVLDAAAAALHIDAATLKTDLQGGKSIADIATAQNVPVQDVINAIQQETAEYQDGYQR